MLVRLDTLVEAARAESGDRGGRRSHIQASPTARGLPLTPGAGGIYHGKLIFPAAYPFKPPSILMLTPSGRFAVNTRLCAQSRARLRPLTASTQLPLHV